MHNERTAIIVCLSALGTLCWAAAGSAWAQSYTIIDLGAHLGDGWSKPTDINADGDVVGERAAPDSPLQPFLWRDGAMVEDLVQPEISHMATAINAAGQVVGMAEVGPGAVAGVWQDNVGTQLAPLPGQTYTWAHDINDAGQIVGESGSFIMGAPGTVQGFDYWAVVWEDSTVDSPSQLDERMSLASGINEAGAVVGWARDTNDMRQAALWQDGTAIDLGTLGGAESMAWDINASGQIVGQADTADGHTRAVLWEDGEITDLGTLPGGTSATAGGINRHGHVVGDSGDHAVLWRDGEIIDLAEMFPEQELWSAAAINDVGQIAVTGDFQGASRAYLLTPTTDEEPGVGEEEPQDGDDGPADSDDEPDDVHQNGDGGPSGRAGRRAFGLCGLGTLPVVCFAALGLPFTWNRRRHRRWDTHDEQPGRRPEP